MNLTREDLKEIVMIVMLTFSFFYAIGVKIESSVLYKQEAKNPYNSFVIK